MGAVRDLVNLLRQRGITVHEWHGWDGRGNQNVPQIQPRGAILHHTGSDYGSAYLGLVESNQRWALGNALANFAGNADGSLTVLASGLTWHAGGGAGPNEGPLAPYRNNRNYYTVGLEIVYPGTSPMTSEQYHTALVFSKAVADLFAKGDIEYVRAHHEVNGRGHEGKPDPGVGVNARGQILSLDMTEFRKQANLATGDLLGVLLSMNDEQLERFWVRGHRATKDAIRDRAKEVISDNRATDNHMIEQTNRMITLTEQNQKIIDLLTILAAKK